MYTQNSVYSKARAEKVQIAWNILWYKTVENTRNIENIPKGI